MSEGDRVNPLKFRFYWELFQICFTVVYVIYVIPINSLFGIGISPIDCLLVFGNTYIMVTYNMVYHELIEKWFGK